jgi:hypothetical protein
MRRESGQLAVRSQHRTQSHAEFSSTFAYEMLPLAPGGKIFKRVFEIAHEAPPTRMTCSPEP